MSGWTWLGPSVEGSWMSLFLLRWDRATKSGFSRKRMNASTWTGLKLKVMGDNGLQSDVRGSSTDLSETGCISLRI